MTTIEITSVVVRSASADRVLGRLDLGVMGCLAERGTEIVSRDDLLREVWDKEQPERFDTRVVDVRMGKIRSALDALWPLPRSPSGALILPIPPRPIVAVRGKGYRLREPAPDCALAVEVTLLPEQEIMVTCETAGHLFAWAAEVRKTWRLEAEPATECEPTEPAYGGVHFL